MSEEPELRRRMLIILGNLMEACKEAAESVMNCELKDLLMVTAQVASAQNEEIKQLAGRALKAAVKHGLVDRTLEWDSDAEE